MIFELGKFYRHTTGEELHIIAEAVSTLYGECFVAESNKNFNLLPVGKKEDNTVNFIEITEEDWMKNFSK